MNCHVWPYTEMAWNEYGVQIKVNSKVKFKFNIFLPPFLFPAVLPLQELCCRAICRSIINVYAIDQLPLPQSVKQNLKSYALTTSQCVNIVNTNAKNRKSYVPTRDSSRNSCTIT